MTDITLRFQVVLYGNYDDISPAPENIIALMKAFSFLNLIPTTIQEFIPPNPNPVNRLSFKSSDEVWGIQFGGNRIDIEHLNQNIGVVSMLAIDNFIKDVKIIIDIISTQFPRKHNRMALVTRYLLPEMEESKFKKSFLKLSNPIPYYSDKDAVDWNSRIVSRVPVKIGEHDETLNVICQVNRLTGNMKSNSTLEPVDRIELHIDLNTYQGVVDFRFDLSDILSFIDYAKSLEEELRTQYKTILEL